MARGAVGRRDRAWRHLEASGELSRRRERRLIDEMGRVLVHLLERDVQALAGGAPFEAVKADLLARRLDPYQAAARLRDTVRSPPDGGESERNRA